MFVPTIGLEVHAELKTKSKMFCGCANSPHVAKPNSNVCPICMGHPGTLPTPNFEAIKHVVTFGRAVKGVVADYSEFDRKNYFYPDIPKAYQISQYAFPFIVGGLVAGVELTRVHLEEDTARSQHDKGDYSLVDFNRAGVPLMELVTEPVIHDAETAGKFAKELQLILRTLGISEANMEKGEMRIEANISVSQSEELGTKVEVKNLNSFKSVELAIAFEIKRQIETLENNGEVMQETRGWDEQKLVTFVQRSKETAKDYRYFPDPDLPKMKLAEIDSLSLSRINEIMPILPQEKRKKYSYLGLSEVDIETIIVTKQIDDFIMAVSEVAGDKQALFRSVVNYTLTDLIPATPDGTSGIIVSPKNFVRLIELATEGSISSRVAKDLIKEFASVHEVDFETIINDRNLLILEDPTVLDDFIKQVLTDNANVVAEYKGGKDTALKYLLGQVMKVSRGSVRPQSAESRLIEIIAETR